MSGIENERTPRYTRKEEEKHGDCSITAVLRWLLLRAAVLEMVRLSRCISSTTGIVVRVIIAWPCYWIPSDSTSRQAGRPGFGAVHRWHPVLLSNWPRLRRSKRRQNTIAFTSGLESCQFRFTAWMNCRRQASLIHTQMEKQMQWFKTIHPTTRTARKPYRLPASGHASEQKLCAQALCPLPRTSWRRVGWRAWSARIAHRTKKGNQRA